MKVKADHSIEHMAREHLMIKVDVARERYLTANGQSFALHAQSDELLLTL